MRVQSVRSSALRAIWAHPRRTCVCIRQFIWAVLCVTLTKETRAAALWRTVLSFDDDALVFRLRLTSAQLTEDILCYTYAWSEILRSMDPH